MTTITTDLVQRARDAHATAEAAIRYQEMRRRNAAVGEIRQALAKLDITPVDQAPAFVNAASGQICVPLIAGELRIETSVDDDGEDSFDYPVQTHAVAAEWDPDERMIRLVADLDYDEDGYRDGGQRLYPAGYLHSLADLGEALERGGRKPTQFPGHSEAERILGAVNGDLVDAHGAVILAAAEAVCAALADVADAIRENHRV